MESSKVATVMLVAGMVLALVVFVVGAAAAVGL
jgi:hypothetical protein